ncbi:MAG: pseudouridine-5'-phosphate glycosidase [Actinobacteria bacterium]|nr:pseudouridine-5'-phosphate glycosidase [Actinomycetota bacterium]
MNSFNFSDEVKRARKNGAPIVALESTIISHGLPRPKNLEIAKEIENTVRGIGAVPATIAMLNGVVHVGLEEAELLEIATSDAVTKASVRDLAILAQQKRHAATTVAATSHIAQAAGISIFATGGLGGVHRGARDTWDESADLYTLARTDITVVCAGVKSILDVAATLERIESLSIGLVGYRTLKFPGFYLRESGFILEYQAASPKDLAEMIRARKKLGTENAALLVANPIEREVPRDIHDRVLASGLALATEQGISGKYVTPFLLDYFHHNSDGESLRANIEIILSNAALAAEIAVALLKLED